MILGVRILSHVTSLMRLKDESTERTAREFQLNVYLNTLNLHFDALRTNRYVMVRKIKKMYKNIMYKIAEFEKLIETKIFYITAALYLSKQAFSISRSTIFGDIIIK